MDTHPYNAPLAYVRPTSDMQIKVSMFVDHNGKIYLPYLHEWNPVSINCDKYSNSGVVETKFHCDCLQFNRIFLLHFIVVIRSIGSNSSDDCHIRRYATSICKAKRTKCAIPSTM